jgi:hypothetical protein
MSHRTRVVRCLLSVLTGSLLLLAGWSAVAQADPYGEIQSFGESEIQTPERAIGYEPETGNVFVVDEDEHNFKILDFGSTGGVYKVVASAVFIPKDPNRAVGPDQIEGVAIDPTMHRLYILAVENRAEEGETPIPDAEVPAAGALYAFSTEPSKGALKPASGTPETGTEKGVLINQERLLPLSSEFGVSLLEPSGIAVDPTTHDVIVAASIDRGKLSDPEEEVFEKEATAVIQRIHSNGELGARYIDEGGFFEECGCDSSPIVSSAGHVYVTGQGDELDEFPTPESTKVPPETVAVTPAPEVKYGLGCEKECRFGSKIEPVEFHEKLTEMPEEPGEFGSSATISPEGAIWARARIQYQLAGPEQEFDYGGALEFGSEFAELGWTGGQSPASAAGKCVVNDLVEAPAMVAGKGGTLFVLDRSPGSGEEKGQRIVEFGPNGNGCPHGSATLSASAGGVEVAEGEPVPVADSVTLGSKLTQANALSVEWEFGDGSTHTVSTREEQAVEIQHTFTEAGDLTVKETIHTDNLATPMIKLERKIDIVGEPTVKTEEASPVEGTSATLKGIVNPNGQQVTACKFEYGETTSYGTSSGSCTPSPGSGEEPKSVSVHVTGLHLGVTYHYRIVATNASGTAEGNDRTFTTSATPTAVTEAASPVGQTSATLNATVNPDSVLTECKFEYGTTKSYSASVPCALSPGSGESPVAVSASLTGLSAGTTYHFRVVAEGMGVAATFGEDKTFRTEESSQNTEEEANRKRLEEEAATAAAAKKHQEEEAAAAAAKKHQEEEAAAAKKRQEEEEAKAKAANKPPTKAQLLAKALKACKKQPKKKRAKCEATARKKYGSKNKKKKKK